MPITTYGEFKHEDAAFIQWLVNLGLIEYLCDGRAGIDGYFWCEGKIETVLYLLFKNINEVAKEFIKLGESR